MDKNTQQPVLTVEIEPDYWSGGHFYEGKRPHVDQAKVRALPIGTKLYTAQPVPRDVLMAALNEVNTKYMEVCGAQFGDEYIAALADRYASQVAQDGPVNRQLLAETVSAYWIDNGVAGQMKEAT